MSDVTPPSTSGSEYSKLAAIEMERHREQMLYADRQLAKAGDFETVARNLRRRSHKRLVVGCVAALLLIRGGGLSVVWAIVILLSCVLDYSHTKRTQETILRMRPAADDDDGAAEAGSTG